MAKWFLLATTLLLTGCLHTFNDYQYQELDYRVKILEKRIQILEMDLDDIVAQCMEPYQNK